MNFNFKEIHIGEIIRFRIKELNIEQERILNFLKCDQEFLLNVLSSGEISTATLLRLSKLLEYDFFRLYSHHLILFSPPSSSKKDRSKNKNSELPQFRKNIYTKDMIDFILELIENGEKTKLQIIEQYKIPKTTLYKWIEKYKK
ncbi:transposase [Chryseobacterium sp. SIMBA_029]|uniref:transposase n=1 Tax=Chryseobacterium sp. SIMBA_029 TaxID=3085772 RepID=UPI00397A1E26